MQYSNNVTDQFKWVYCYFIVVLITYLYAFILKLKSVIGNELLQPAGRFDADCVRYLASRVFPFCFGNATLCQARLAEVLGSCLVQARLNC